MSNLNVRQSLSLTSTIRNPITKAARNPAQSNAAPLLSDQPLSLHSVTSGFNIAIRNTSEIVMSPTDAGRTTIADVDPNQMLVDSDNQLSNSCDSEQQDNLVQDLPMQLLSTPPSATNHLDSRSITEVLSHARVMAATAQ